MEPSCDAARLEKMQIYMSMQTNEPSSDDWLANYELIPMQQWGGSLKECGLKEGYILYFTTRTNLNKKPPVVPIKRESSHVRSSIGTTNLPQISGTPYGILGSPKLQPPNL